MHDKIEQSKEIIQYAIKQYNPSAICMMLSGGDDSITALSLMRYLGIKIDFVIHGNTGTGLPAATEFARTLSLPSEKYIETNAKKDFEDYVLRKGFFGSGVSAHSYAYHVLKAGPFRKAISANIRKGKRGMNVLCVNGVRVDESQNRMDNFGDQVYRADPAQWAKKNRAAGILSGNIWTNLIHYWTKKDCLDFLEMMEVKRSPVAIALGASRECMCGTMQSQGDYMAAASFDPQWGKDFYALRKEVVKLHGWDWGQSMPKKCSAPLVGMNPDFMPACTGCKRRNKLPAPLDNPLIAPL